MVNIAPIHGTPVKTLLSLLLLINCLASHIHAQGTVSFANNTSTRVFLPGGTTACPTNAGYRAELVYAPDGTALDLFDAVALRLGADTPVGFPAPGFFFGGARTAPTTTPGGFGLFQVRVWNPSHAPDWRTAAFNNFCVGTSAIMRIDTGDPTTTPPGVPAPLVGNGLTAITLGHLGWPPCIIPEPSLLALCGLCVSALCLRRLIRRGE